jgi:YidC/Oxa1 family membrane protein insertase
MQVQSYGFKDNNGGHQAYVEVTLLAQGGGQIVLKPTQKFEAAWTITAASMNKRDLALLGETAAKVEYSDGYYRFFKSLAWLLTISLDGLVLVVLNYGVAVVVLTFLIKLLLHRTTFKQHESMMKMQKLAPELKLLQEQYKTDKQKLAMKQMELWKKHGVNPLGGCLPILIQIPIFTALYLAFCHSADMRGSGFLWINDLTLPDQLVGWVVGGWTLSINPLPILYIGVSIWMSMMQKVPPGADPQQEQMMKMMRWLPVVFGVIFYNFPSGLVLYFTINAVLSTIEIKMVRKKLGMP